jgi:hypothetical protein
MPSDFPTGRQAPAHNNSVDALWISNDFSHLGAQIIAANERHRGYLAEAEQERLLTEAGVLPPRRSPGQILAMALDWLRVRAAGVRRQAVNVDRPVPAPSQ